MNEARLYIQGKHLSVHDWEFRRLINVIPADIELSFYELNALSGNTVLYFKSTLFKVNNTFQYSQVKWDGVRLDFDDCWDTTKKSATFASTPTSSMSTSTYDPDGLTFYDSNSDTTPTPPCYHKWVVYQGIMTSYDYCSDCGVKK
jgi:hypothetical protein